jgi:hypothetical protein
MQMILLGAACEDLWRRLIERKAWAQYRNQRHVKDIRQERAQFSTTRGAPRTISRQERALIPKALISDVSEGIDEILDHAGRGRFASIPLKRPKGKRDRVKRVVVRWARCAHRIVVSPRRVEDCWDEYRRDFPTDVDFHTK